MTLGWSEKEYVVRVAALRTSQEGLEFQDRLRRKTRLREVGEIIFECHRGVNDRERRYCKPPLRSTTKNDYTSLWAIDAQGIFVSQKKEISSHSWL